MYQDNDCIWIRKHTESVECDLDFIKPFKELLSEFNRRGLDNEEFLRNAFHLSNKCQPCLHLWLLSVCGKLYIGGHISSYSVYRYLPDLYVNTQVKDIIKSFSKRPIDFSVISRYTVENVYDPINNLLAHEGEHPKLVELHKQFKTPLIRFNRNSITLNPILKDLKFGDYIDNYTLLQEITLFYNQYLREQPEMVEISDKDKIHAHGFDVKESFRTSKPGGPKRKHKRKNK